MAFSTLYNALPVLPTFVRMVDVEYQPSNDVFEPGTVDFEPCVFFETHYPDGKKGDKFKCFCGETYKIKNSLTRHVRVSGVGSNIKCDHCSHATNRSDNLVQHLRNSHPGAFHAKCGVCGKWIYNPKDLAPHSNHARGYSMTCGLCGRTFYTPDSYEDHMKRRHPRRA